MELLVIFAGAVALLTILKFVLNMETNIYFGFLGATVVIGLLFWGLSSFNFNAMDTEIWNGEVSGKKREVQYCPTGWVRSTDNFCTEYTTRSVYDGKSCHYTGSGKDRKKVCHDEYHTEYNYDYPWEAKWFIAAANIGEHWEIRRVDYQGAKEPPRWTAINVGDPASTARTYTNWVKAAADSIFHEDAGSLDKYKEFIPAYPMEFYDVMKVRRIVPIGVTIQNIDQYNDKLAVALKSLGPQRQMNAIIVVADASKFGPDLQYAVRRAWSGFKKNDAVTFIGVNKNNEVEWANSLSWSKQSIYDIEVREKILEGAQKPLDLNATIDNIQTIGMKNYVRRSMDEFEFLKSEIRTPLSLIILALFFQAIPILGAFFITRKETYVYR
jgi:hypothetical protein